MLYAEIITIGCQDHINPINAMCAFRAKLHGTYIMNHALQGQYSRHLSYSGQHFLFFVYNLEIRRL